jgi:hypothetical protein
MHDMGRNEAAALRNAAKKAAEAAVLEFTPKAPVPQTPLPNVTYGSPASPSNPGQADVARRNGCVRLRSPPAPPAGIDRLGSGEIHLVTEFALLSIQSL